MSSVCLSRVCYSTKEIERERERERGKERERTRKILLGKFSVRFSLSLFVMSRVCRV